jgi:GTPase SAR1 family protein
MTNTLDIVLLGGPAAGKTSLVGALVQAAQTQAAVLQGQLKTVPQQLDKIRDATYQKGPATTRDDVEAIPITLEPAAKSKAAAIKAKITDCSGAAGQAVLVGKTPLEARAPLARAILEADTVLLVVDAAAGPAELDRDFEQLGLFLRRFQESRGARADIAGLPVYLVLSKCDLLARSSDTHSQWMQRIEEGKRRLGERFRDFAKAQEGVPFGAIDLHLWATAVKRPALADRPAKPDEPYGVAELFRQVFDSARDFQHARDQASGRLSLAVTGTLGLLAVLAIVGSLFVALRPSVALTDLENRAKNVLAGQSSADRLREPLDERLAELKQIQAHPVFVELPEKLQEEVAEAEREIAAYQKASRDLFSKVSDPRFATREDDLTEIAKKLDAYRLPAEYAVAWSDSKLAKRLAQWQFDIQKLREAVAEEEKWMREQIAQGEALQTKGGLVIAKSLPAAERDAWFVQVKDYLEREPRHKRSERVAPGASLTYDSVYKFQRVEAARKEWDRAKEKLKNLRQLAE